MSRQGYERNSFYSENFKATNISLRGFRFRDLKSSTNREIATAQKQVYLETEKLMADNLGGKNPYK